MCLSVASTMAPPALNRFGHDEALEVSIFSSHAPFWAPAAAPPTKSPQPRCPSFHHCSETLLLKLLTCLDSLLQCSFSSRMDDLICSLDVLNGFHWGKQMGKDSKLQQNYFNTEVDVCFSVLIHVYHVMFDMQYSVHLSHCLSVIPCYSPFAADRPCHRAAWCVSSAPLCSKANPAGVCAWQAKHKIDSMILILSSLSTSRTK